MKQYFLFIITGLALLWSTSSYAVGDGTLGYGGGVNDNPHNLSSQSQNAVRADLIQTDSDDKETQICVFCHTPHGAAATPLWNRTLDTTTTFPLRSGLVIATTAVAASLYDNADPAAYPNGASKLCLSCHDGVTAIGILATDKPIDVTPINLSGRTSDIDLATSHPISFVYDAAVLAFLDATYQLPPDTGYLDNNNRMQCTSCHQPHQDTRLTGTNYPFWRVGSGTSADYDTVCQQCHQSTPGIPGGIGEHQYNP